MRPIVLDCSVAIAWAVRENEPAERPDAMIEHVVAAGGIVPPVWPLEVVNVLLVAERRGRVDASTADELLARLSKVPVRIDANAGVATLKSVLDLARSRNFSGYDAAYLDVAIRHKAILATFDERLKAAASQVNVEVL